MNFSNFEKKMNLIGARVDHQFVVKNIEYVLIGQKGDIYMIVMENVILI